MKRLGGVLLTVCMGIVALSVHGIPVQGAHTMQVVATVPGQPDDITVDPQRRLVWGDLQNGTIDRLQRGRVLTIARGLSVPEGVLVLANGDVIVAEQGPDRVVRIDTHGRVSVVFQLQPVLGQEGVDAIARDPRTGGIIVPDSPRGTVLRINLNTGRSTVIASGLGRPVHAAVDTHGNVLVPDEHLGTLVVIAPSGAVSHVGAFQTPDDVAVSATGQIWVTSLGDGGLWRISPHRAPQRILVGLSSPQGMTLDACGNPIIVEQNAARIVRLLSSRHARDCPF